MTGALVNEPGEMRELLARHVVSPVRWEACAQALRTAGAEVFLEAGPGDVLTKLAKRVVPGARAVAVGSPDAAADAVAGLAAGTSRPHRACELPSSRATACGSDILAS